MSQAKDDFIAKTIQYWNPGKTLEWQRQGIDLVIDRREGYYLYDMDGRRLINLHLNGGIYSPRPPQPGSDRRGPRGDGAFRHRQPPLPGADADRARRDAGEARAARPPLLDVRLGRRRGDRHRLEERPPRHPAPAHHLPAALLPRPHRPRGPGRRRPLLQALPVRGARGATSPRSRSTISTAMERGDRQGRRGLRHHRVDSRDLRLPDAAPRLPRRDQGGLREGRHALHRRRGADRPDALRRDVVHRHLWRRPRHDRHRQGPVRRHLSDRRGHRQREVRGVAQGGRLGPHVELRRRRARLHRRAQGDGDRVAAGDAVRSATTSPTISARASPRSRRTIPTSSSASASAA